ncbi:hypothetical protein ABZ401_32435 [Streptomyces sp. NPDC005892]
MSGVVPQDDEHGRPIHLELCPACDVGDVDWPAAGLSVQFSLTVAAVTRAACRAPPTC